MMEAVRTSETSVDNHFTRQYNPEDSSEHLILSLLSLNVITVSHEVLSPSLYGALAGKVQTFSEGCLQF
jgi:hypothetical protein